MAVSGGGTEGSCVQEYEIVVDGKGFASQVIGVKKAPEDKNDILAGVDFVLGQQANKVE